MGLEPSLFLPIAHHPRLPSPGGTPSNPCPPLSLPCGPSGDGPGIHTLACLLGNCVCLLLLPTPKLLAERFAFPMSSQKLWATFVACPPVASLELILAFVFRLTFFLAPYYVPTLVFLSILIPSFNLCTLVIYVYPCKHLKSFPEMLGRNPKCHFYLHLESGSGQTSQ